MWAPTAPGFAGGEGCGIARVSRFAYGLVAYVGRNGQRRLKLGGVAGNSAAEVHPHVR